MSKAKELLERLKNPYRESFDYKDFELALKTKESQTILGNQEIIINKGTNNVSFFSIDKKYSIVISLDLDQFILQHGTKIIDSYWIADDLSVNSIIENLVKKCPSKFSTNLITILKKWADT